MIQPEKKRTRGSREMDDERIESETSGNPEDDVDALFKLPLAESLAHATISPRG